MRLFKKSKNNIIYLGSDGVFKKVKSVKGLTINFTGKNNTVYIDKSVQFRDCVLECANNNIVKFGESNVYGFNCVKFWISSDNCLLDIGKNVTCHGGIFHLRNKPDTKIIIGDNCLFSGDIELRTSDGHSIYDLDTKELINPDGDIVIGNNVWLGHGVHVLKGVTIASNIVVATHAIVTKDLTEQHSIYAGIPAKLVKTNVMWDWNSPHKYNKDMV